jgi:hypothetical protein
VTGKGAGTLEGGWAAEVGWAPEAECCWSKVVRLEYSASSTIRAKLATMTHSLAQARAATQEKVLGALAAMVVMEKASAGHGRGRGAEGASTPAVCPVALAASNAMRAAGRQGTTGVRAMRSLGLDQGSHEGSAVVPPEPTATAVGSPGKEKAATETCAPRVSSQGRRGVPW